MHRKAVGCLFLISLVMTAQERRDAAPLRHWSAPLYWQPSVEERVRATKPETVPLAETPVNSLVFVGMTPCRLVDTRTGSGFPAAFGPPSLVAGVVRSFPLQSSTTCSIPPIAQAYSLNVTVIPSGALGYLTIWPYGAPQPLASTLNDLFGAIIANAAIVPAGNDVFGSVNVYASGGTDLVLDINGYYAAQSGITLAQGTAAAPSLSFAGDAGTGVYSSGAGTVNIATGGTNSLTVAPNGNVGIGTTAAPAAKLEVNGNAEVDGNVILGGSILAPSGASLVQYTGTNFSGGLAALGPLTTGVDNTAIGDSALAQDTAGGGNTAVGFSALKANTTGQSNAAIGAFALSANTSGSDNTAFLGLFANTSGNDNVALGVNSLTSNTTGSYNVAVGFEAISANLTACCNTAVGNGALILGTGPSNVAIGYQSLVNLTTGSYNIAIGPEAGNAVVGTSNNIHIGSQGSGADSGVIRIGTPCGTGTGSVCQTSAFISGIQGVTTGSSNAVPVVIDSNGQLGTMNSSRRYKEDIQDMGDASSGLMQLRPVTFRYQKPHDDGSKPLQYGLIAEEVAEVYPDLVARSADGQVQSVRYQLLDPMLLNELQKQQEQIRSLEERLARLEALLAQQAGASK